MNVKDLKYIFAYITPLSCYLSFIGDGIWSFTSVFILFGFLPIADQILPLSTSNFTEEEELGRNKSIFFNALLFLNLPILWMLGFWYLSIVSAGSLGVMDLIGKTLAMGIMSGTIGINVAHEIGHRPGFINQWASRLLLMPALYMHFNIEHNRGHHKWVATPIDPATSRKGESFYRFWCRSVFYSYLAAWKIENDDLKKIGKSAFSLRNKMVLFTLFQFILIASIYLYFGLFGVSMFLITAVLGFTLLEQVNYIEHYGLVRDLLPSGRYEKIQPHHSWNSNHEVGRVVLYELTRHSDHHFKSTRKYQVLRHHDDTPQLPLGYPASIMIAMIPPLWFKLMDKQLEKQVAVAI